MGGSVGVGALVIGVALLGVFAVATQAIEAQLQSSLDTVDAAGDPLPSVSIINASDELWGINDVAISSGGTGYAAGTITTAGGTGSGFSATYTVDISTGAIDGITIISRGSWTVAPTSLSASDPGNGGVGASLTPTLGTVVYANITNDGSQTIAYDDIWFSIDGQSPERVSDYYSSTSSREYLFAGDIVSIIWDDGATGTSTDFGRLAINGMGHTEVNNI
jgi:hypothetical protein